MLEKFNLVETSSTAVKVGDVFGRLLVMAVGQKRNTYRYFSVCQCSCGSQLKAIRSDGLIMGVVESCGCLQKERTTTHGQTKSPHYYRWRHMMARCYDSNSKAYADYGGRGIKVCDRWHDISKFVLDLPEGFKKGLEIDRIDNNGDYEPGNVRWATDSQNSDNRRTARLLTLNGKTQSLRRWSEEVGIDERVISSRIIKYGWNDEKALTTPPMSATERMEEAHKTRWAGHKKKADPTPKPPLMRFPVGGEMLTISEISEKTGISGKLLRKRIVERGWPVDRAVIS